MPESLEPRWWLLIHQIPPKPAYLRVKVSRQLRRVGAVAVKNTVYALPATDAAREDFQWVLAQVVEGGGEALICEARFVEGLSDAEVQRLFTNERDADYASVAKEARDLGSRSERFDAAETRATLDVAVTRLERRLEELAEIDFFDAPGRVATQALVDGLRRRLSHPSPHENTMSKPTPVEDWRHRTWVTRTGVKVDRIASAWLVRRFVDADARFKFVPAKGYEPAPGEVRFDMFEAEFTHEGELCTFEVLLRRLGIERRGLQALAEVVHDIDLKDAKYGRPETRGVAAAIDGLVATCPTDEQRLELGFALFDSLLATFSTGAAKR
jgi:hypothetical protein